MFKADLYRQRAELCENRAGAGIPEVAYIWRTLGSQYRFLEELERRSAGHTLSGLDVEPPPPQPAAEPQPTDQA